MNKIFGIFFIIMALAIAIVPAFTDCQSQGKALTTSMGKEIPMKCHWTGVAEIGVAAPLLAIGAIMLTSRRRDSARIFSPVVIVLGALAVAFPAGLIGVCATPTMLCHTAMKPILLVLGSLVIVGGLAAIVFGSKEKNQD